MMKVVLVLAFDGFRHVGLVHAWETQPAVASPECDGNGVGAVAGCLPALPASESLLLQLGSGAPPQAAPTPESLLEENTKWWPWGEEDKCDATAMFGVIRQSAWRRHENKCKCKEKDHVLACEDDACPQIGRYFPEEGLGGRRCWCVVDQCPDWMSESTLDGALLGDSADTAKLTDSDKVGLAADAREDADEVLAEGGEEALRERQAYEKSFATEHQTAIRELRQHPEMKDGQVPCRRHAGAGEISGLYTFGSPGTAISPLSNPQREDGQFPGLRVFTQRIRQVLGFKWAYSDPVTFAAGIVGLKHPRMDAVALPVNQTPNWHWESGETCSSPRSDLGFWVKGHFMTEYTAQLAAHREKFDPLVWDMSELSKAVYLTDGREMNARDAARAGWNLVAQSKNAKLHKDDLVFQDHTSLYQNPVTRACTLAFVGTHQLSHWIVNLKLARTKFCGIPNVHKGFANQVRRVLRSPTWDSQMRPALAACPALYLTGHSLGAAQAQLIAACLQRAPAKGEPGWNDYQHLAWVPDPSKARTLPGLEPKIKACTLVAAGCYTLKDRAQCLSSLDGRSGYAGKCVWHPRRFHSNNLCETMAWVEKTKEGLTSDMEVGCQDQGPTLPAAESLLLQLGSGVPPQVAMERQPPPTPESLLEENDAGCGAAAAGGVRRKSAWRRQDQCKCKEKDHVLMCEDDMCPKIGRYFPEEGLGRRCWCVSVDVCQER